MSSFIRTVLIGFLLMSVQSAEARQRAYPKTDEALEQAFMALNWEEQPGNYSLGVSHTEYTLSEGLFILRGDDAREFLFLNNGTEFPDAEAVVFDPETMNQLIFSYFEEGYVKDDDWADLDADLLLEGITENTEEANAERRKNGIGTIEILGWSQKPAYDTPSRTAYWAIKANDTDITIVNAIALKLGRKGFSKLTWVGDTEQFESSDGLLIEAINNHRFEKGFRYADYSSGDKLAAVGLASLVAVTAGSKSGKGVVAGILATLLLFAKKLWFLIFLPFVFLWKWIKRLFAGQQTP